MSASKHTPGPWEVLRVDNILAIMPDPIRGKPDSFLGIATVQEHDEERSAGRIEANARLIAAAPELLEALKAITKVNMESAVLIYQRMEEIARAAIAKAEGTP